MTKKSQITDISNIHEIRHNGRYRITWRDNGKFHSRTSKDKKKIENLYITLITESGIHEKNMEGAILTPLYDIQPGPKMFKQLTSDVISASHRAVNTGDMTALKRLKEYAGIVSTLSKSYHPWSDFEETVEEFQKLVDYHESTEKQNLREGQFAQKQENGSSVKKSLETDTRSEKQIFPLGN